MTTIGWIDIQDREASCLGFVLDKHLELTKAPPVQPGPESFSSLDPLADVSQVFKYNHSCLLVYRFLNDLFTEFMVGMSHTAPFFARDFLQQLSCRWRTVGLKDTPFCKKLISLMADLASAKNLSTAGCKNVILPQIHSQKIFTLLKGWIGKIQNKVKIPFSLFTDQLALFWDAFQKALFLKGAKSHLNLDSFSKCIKRNGLTLDCISPFIKMGASSLAKDNQRNFFLRKNSLSLISFTDRKDGIADHLRSQRRAFSNLRIDEGMESISIPAPIFSSNSSNLVAGRKIGLLQLQKFFTLLKGCVQSDADRSLHGQKLSLEFILFSTLKRGAALPPSPKGLGFRAVVTG